MYLQKKTLTTFEPKWSHNIERMIMSWKKVKFKHKRSGPYILLLCVIHVEIKNVAWKVKLLWDRINNRELKAEVTFIKATGQGYIEANEDLTLQSIFWNSCTKHFYVFNHIKQFT